MPAAAVWPGVFENWSRQFVWKNHWRVKALMDQDDALQECALVFSKCLKDYPDVDNPAWLMSLYQTCLKHHFHHLSTKNTHNPALVYTDAQIGHSAVAYNEGPLLAALTESSTELREVLSVISQAPTEFLEILLHSTNSEKWSRRLYRLIGLQPKHNLIEEMKTLLSQREEPKVTTFTELLDLAKKAKKDFKAQAKGEKTQAFLSRLLTSVFELKDPDLEAAPDEVRAYLETVVDAMNAGETITPPDGYTEPEPVAAKAAAAKGNGQEKAPAVVATAATGRRGRPSPLSPTAKIKILDPEKPVYKTESKHWHLYEPIKDGMTVQEALDAGSRSDCLTYLLKVSKRIELVE